MLRYTPLSSGRSYAVGLIINFAGWIIVLAWLMSEHPDGLLQMVTEHSATFAVFGVIAMWRYLWLATHFCRAMIYQYVTFPRVRLASQNAGKASHIYAVVLSYRMESDVNATAYMAIARDIAHYGCAGTIVACISDQADIDLLESLPLPACVRLIPLMQSGRGKRDAMERALTFLANESRPANACLALIDGDSVLPPGTFSRTACLLMHDPHIGAVTANNTPAVWGSDLIRNWYWLRMQQRHLLMCSMSMSQKVLVLTGRYSLFRADIGLSREFIAQVGRDVIDHWRIGRIRMLTGDDKSTWFSVLKHGWGMLYVPDVHVCCLEKPAGNGLLNSTVPLMARYYGNMARNNGRAIRLGPRAIGLFTWWSLIDQRLSPWTTMLAPTVAVTASVLWWHSAFIAYLSWAFFTRTVQCLGIWLLCRRVHPYMTFLLMYNQMTGAAVKVFVFFNLDRQRWTRQNTGSSARAAAVYSSAPLMWTSVTLMVLAVCLMVVSL